MLTPDESRDALRMIARGIEDPGFCCEVIALLTRCNFICPSTPKLREWLTATTRHLQRQGIRRADLRLLLVQRFDLARTEADKIIEGASIKTGKF